MTSDDGHETSTMARRSALRAMAGTVGASGAALAGMLAAQATPAAAQGVPGQEIVGSWLNVGGNGRGPKVATFNADGGWSNVHSDSNRTPAHGSWVRVGERTFHITRWSIRFDEQGRAIRRVKTRAESVVDPDGQGLTSRRITEAYDLATGKLIYTTPVIESRSTRITPEPFP